MTDAKRTRKPKAEPKPHFITCPVCDHRLVPPSCNHCGFTPPNVDEQAKQTASE